MFDLELNISSWSDRLRSGGKLGEDDVLELENHLREQIDELLDKGLTEDEAFLISVKRLGNVNLISEEYSKVNTESLWKHLLLDSIDPADKKQTRRDLLLVVIFSLLAGTVAKIPVLFGIVTEDIVYLKNISFFILPFIVLFFAIRHSVDRKLTGYVLGIFVLSALTVNLYPSFNPNHTEILTGIHLPIMLWLVTGVVYAGKNWKDDKDRMNFIRFTGECVIYGSLIMFGLIVLTMFTIMIFNAISIDVSKFVSDYVVIYGGCAAAIITVYLVETKKSVIENFAPVLAKIFSPLFLVTLAAFLIVMVITGHSPFMDRDFLIGFDLMLVLVLGMVLYIISARNIHENNNIYDYLNTALIITAIVVDGVALSAIIFRLSEYGITPNKLAALGENILLLVNLAGLLWLYINYFRNRTEFKKIETWQTSYLTVYAIWMAIVVFIFPIIFAFR